MSLPLNSSVISPSSMILGNFLTALNLSVLGCKMGIITVSTSQLYEKLNRQSAKFRICCYVTILYRNNTHSSHISVPHPLWLVVPLADFEILVILLNYDSALL